jgi:putative intracellular protease/amidase
MKVFSTAWILSVSISIASSARVAMMVTNHGTLGDTGRATGWYLPEVAEPWQKLTQAGHQVVFVSPLGGYAPMDPKSQLLFGLLPASQALLHNPSVMAQLNHTKSVHEIQAKDFDAIFFAGGHGPMWDMTGDAVAQLTRQFWEQGSIVSAVCHGPAGLVNVRLSDGNFLVHQRKVTGYSNSEEGLGDDLSAVLPFMLQDELSRKGGIYSQAITPFTSHVVVDGKLITGQNPQSTAETADAVLEALKHSVS